MLAASGSYRLRARIVKTMSRLAFRPSRFGEGLRQRRRCPREASEDLHKLPSPAGVMLGRARTADSGVSKSQYSNGARFLSAPGLRIGRGGE
jgi:hypothetical protein